MECIFRDLKMDGERYANGLPGVRDMPFVLRVVCETRRGGRGSVEGKVRCVPVEWGRILTRG